VEECNIQQCQLNFHTIVSFSSSNLIIQDTTNSPWFANKDTMSNCWWNVPFYNKDYIYMTKLETKEPNNFYEVVQHVGWRITVQQKYMIP